LVEDNLTNQGLIQKMISRWGATVDCADHGKIAVEKIKTGAYDLVLMDLQMPVMDGYETHRTFREMGFTTQQLPVVALTAYASAEDKAKVFSEGMADFVSKPIDRNELFQKIVKSVRAKTGSLPVDEPAHPQKNKVVPLDELIESFRDDQAFIHNYLNSLRKDFADLAEKVSAYAEKRDVQSLSQTIHKLAPSIQQIGNGLLLKEQLNSLKSAISDGAAGNRDLDSIQKEIESSCTDAMNLIKSLEEKYVQPNS